MPFELNHFERNWCWWYIVSDMEMVHVETQNGLDIEWVILIQGIERATLRMLSIKELSVSRDYLRGRKSVFRQSWLARQDHDPIQVEHFFRHAKHADLNHLIPFYISRGVNMLPWMDRSFVRLLFPIGVFSGSWQVMTKHLETTSKMLPCLRKYCYIYFSVDFIFGIPGLWCFWGL